MSSAPILTCWTVSGNEQPTTFKDLENAEGQILHQEKGKKSSFLLNLDDSLLERPDQTQIIVENDPELQHHYFLGGFQIISNAKQSKVYLTGRDGKEAYLTTSKGIPFEKESGKPWYKSVCVVPGGPRLITRLRLEISNVQPHQEGDDSTMTKIRYLKLTARIPDKAPPAAVAQLSTQNQQLGAAPMPKLQQGAGSAFATAPPTLAAMFQGQNGSAFVPTVGMNPRNIGAMPPAMTQAFGGHAFSQMQQGPPPLTQDDLGAAMAGISMMARSTQESMEKSFQTKVTEIQAHMDAQWGKVEGYIGALTQVVVSQKTVLDEKNKIMQQQHEMVAEQSKQIAILLQQQTELQSTVQSLQLEMKALQERIGKSSNIVITSGETTSAVQTRTIVESSPPSQDVLQAVAKTALAEQQAAISPAIASIQTNTESLGEYIKGNRTQDDLRDSLETIQEDVMALKEMTSFAKHTTKIQEEKLSSTLESLQSELRQVRESIQEDSDKRDQISTAIENVQSTLTKLERVVVEPRVDPPTAESSIVQEHQQQQHLALSASVDELQKDVAILRESVEKTAQEGSNQQKALENNFDSLKWDFSEMQRSMQEKAENNIQQAVMEESKPKAKEIVLTGIRDFEQDIFAIRSLEDADGSLDEDEKKIDRLQRQPTATAHPLLEMKAPPIPRPLTPDRPPNPNIVLKESLVLKQSIEALKEFRQISQSKEQVKSTSSGDSHGSVTSITTPQEDSVTSTSSPPTPPMANLSKGKPPLAPSSSTLSASSSSSSNPPAPSLNRLVNSGSLMDSEESELVEGEIIEDYEDGEIAETEVSFGEEDGEFIVSVETKDACTSSNEILRNPDKVDTKETVTENVQEPTKSTGPAKRNLGSLVMEPNGSLVVDVDEDGISLEDVDLGSLGENEGGGKGNSIARDEGVAAKENTSDNGQTKDGKRVSFRDAALEDRYEYTPEEVQLSGSTGADSVGTESTGEDTTSSEPESEGLLEMGMKLFNNAGWL